MVLGNNGAWWGSAVWSEALGQSFLHALPLLLLFLDGTRQERIVLVFPTRTFSSFHNMFYYAQVWARVSSHPTSTSTPLSRESIPTNSLISYQIYSWVRSFDGSRITCYSSHPVHLLRFMRLKILTVLRDSFLIGLVTVFRSTLFRRLQITELYWLGLRWARHPGNRNKSTLDVYPFSDKPSFPHAIRNFQYK